MTGVSVVRVVGSGLRGRPAGVRISRRARTALSTYSTVLPRRKYRYCSLYSWLLDVCALSIDVLRAVDGGIFCEQG